MKTKMNLISQSLFGSSGITGDFNFPRAYVTNDTSMQYDVNGNHSNKAVACNEDPGTEGRGPAYTFRPASPSLPTLSDSQAAHGTIHYIPTSSISTSSYLQHRQSANGATSSIIAHPPVWNHNASTSVLRQLQPSVMGHSSHIVPGGDFPVPSLPLLHWPTGGSTVPTTDNNITAGRRYDQYGMQPSGGGFDNLPSWSTVAPPENNSSTASVAGSSPAWWPGDADDDVIVPVPTRILSSADIALLQNDAPTSVCKLGPPEDIHPESFTTRLPVVIKPIISPSRVRHASTSSTASSTGDIHLGMEVGNPMMRTDKQKRVSYLEMVARALMSSSDLCLPLAKIYSYVESTYCHLQTVAVKSWKNSVRHTLSSQPCFLKNQGSVFSLHTWRLHSSFVADFKLNRFDSGLVKKKAKDLQRIPNSTQVMCSATHAQKAPSQQEESRVTDPGMFKFPDIIPHVESFAGSLK